MKKPKKSKRIELEHDVIKRLTIQAINNDTKFKPFVENLLILKSKEK